jgi:CHC2 zinc finger
MLKTLSSKTGQLLSQLDRVKQTGQSKWLARCPAHNDKSPSLAIKEVGDRILIHCFAGCGVSEVLNAVGLDLADLFPDRVVEHYGPAPKIPKFSAYELFPLLVQEALILALACNDSMIKGVLPDADYQRAQQACQCVMRLHAEVSR